jgi:hypothetical protein
MLKRFALYKMSQYLLDVGSQFGRDRVRGVCMAIRKMADLLNTPPDLLRQRYLELCRQVKAIEYEKK